MVYPNQDGNGVPRVQSSSVGDFYVAGTPPVEYRGAIFTTVGAWSVSHANNACAWVFAAADVSSASWTIKWVNSKRTWKTDWILEKDTLILHFIQKTIGKHENDRKIGRQSLA